MWKKQCVKRRKKEEKKNLDSWNHNQYLSHSQLTTLHRWCSLISILILLILIHQNKRLFILFDAHQFKQSHQLHQAQLIQHLDIVNDDINDLTLAVLQRLQFLVDAVLDDEMNDEDFEELIDAKNATEDLLFHAAVSSQINADDAQDQFLIDAVLNNMMSDEDFEELIDVKDVTEDLLFHAAVSSQIDADDMQDHDEIKLDIIAFEKDDHDLRDQIVVKHDDDVIANFLIHFVMIVDKDSVTLLKEMIQHFHAVLQLACSQVRKLMTR